MRTGEERRLSLRAAHRFPLAWLAAAAVLATAGPVSVSAQSVLVRVLESPSGQPLQGTLVTLTDGGGGFVKSALTDARGRFLFVGVEAGRYGLRAEMIGHTTGLRDEIVVAPGETVEVRMRLPVRALELHGLDVEGDERCRLRPEEGLQVAAVWDEARKALEAARWTEERGVYEYRTQKVVRDVELESRRIVHQERERSVGYLRTPYESLPAERLAAGGFVQDASDGQGDVYYAPDARALLSDAFLDTHCMRLRIGEGEHEGWVGLAFEPLRGRRIPDIQGTLWMDMESRELRRLAYRYVNLRWGGHLERVGGEVHFRRLPDGTWIIPEWTIRMPIMGRSRDLQGRQQVFQVGLREEGGQVLRVREPGGRVILTSTTGTLEGVVVDSLGLEAVQGATVELMGTGETTETDSTGTYFFSELPPGSYRVTFTHPKLDDFGYRPEPSTVDVARGEVTSARLRMPSRKALLAALCEAELGQERPRGTGVLVGRILEEGTGLPLAGAVVRIGWADHDFSATSDNEPTGERSAAGVEYGWNWRLSTDSLGLDAVANEEGHYRACVVPELTHLTLTPSWGPFNGAPDTTRIPEDTLVLVRDLSLRLQGFATVEGSVVESPGGIPVEGVEVRLEVEADSVRVWTALTGKDGRFLMEDVPAGTHLLEAAHPAYTVSGDSVRLRPGERVDLRVRLPRIDRRVRRLVPTMRLPGLTVEVRRREALEWTPTWRSNSVEGAEMEELRRRAADMRALFRRAMPRVQVVELPSRSGMAFDLCVRSTRARGPVSRPATCLKPMVLVDGAVYYRPGPGPDPSGVFRELFRMKAEDIERVRYLTPAEGNFRYGIPGGSGVIVIETRRAEGR